MNAGDDKALMVEEYKCVCDFMRQVARLRFFQLALLLGTTGGIVGALSSQAVRLSPAHAQLLKGGAVGVSLALAVMEFRSSTHWQHLRDRGNELASALRFRPFTTSSRWSPWTTSGAGFYLHALVAALWGASLWIVPRA